MNWVVAGLLCALLFTDWRFDLALPDVQIPELSLAVGGLPFLIGVLLLFYIALNSGS